MITMLRLPPHRQGCYPSLCQVAAAGVGGRASSQPTSPPRQQPGRGNAATSLAPYWKQDCTPVLCSQYSCRHLCSTCYGWRVDRKTCSQYRFASRCGGTVPSQVVDCHKGAWYFIWLLLVTSCASACCMVCQWRQLRTAVIESRYNPCQC